MELEMVRVSIGDVILSWEGEVVRRKLGGI